MLGLRYKSNLFATTHTKRLSITQVFKHARYSTSAAFHIDGKPNVSEGIWDKLDGFVVDDFRFKVGSSFTFFAAQVD
jgi:hypothetical protein